LVSAPISIDSTIKGGESGKTIFAVGVKATNSDITIKRFDVDMKSEEAGLIPWKYFSKLSLYKDGTLVQSIDVTNSNLNEVEYAREYIARFDGLNTVIAKDTTANFSVKADLVSTIPTSPASLHVNVNVNTDNAIRGVDGLGLNQYVHDSGTTYNKKITISGSTQGSLKLTLDANTPKASNIISDKNGATNDNIGLVFDLKASNADITIKGVTANVTTTAGIISGVSLYDGSTKLATVSLTDSTNVTTTAKFTNLSIPVAKDATKVLTLKFDLVANATTTTPIIFSVPSDDA